MKIVQSQINPRQLLNGNSAIPISSFSLEENVTMEKGNVALEKAFRLSVLIIELSKVLNQKKSFDLSRQLVRSGTSVGANLNEAQSPFSRSDLIFKFNLAMKEALETRYWLKLVAETEGIDVEEAMNLNQELIKILNKSITTAKRNTKRVS